MKLLLAVSVAAVILGGGASRATRTPSCQGELVSASLGVATCDLRVFAGNPVGTTWREITPPRIPGTTYRGTISSVEFVDERTGWVLTNECAAGRAAVHRTRDGGRTWMSRAIEGTGCSLLNGVSLVAVDNRHAWLDYRSGGLNGSLMATTDGGRSWTGVGALPFPGAVRFRTRSQGWLARPWGEGGIQQLHETRDGGRTWRRRILPPPAGWSGARIFPDLPTFFGDRGVLPATLTRNGSAAVAFYATEDQGRTWRVRAVRRVDYPVLHGHPAIVWYVPASAVDVSTWWIAEGRARPFVSVTSDGGRSWLRSSHLPRSHWWTISASSARRAWLSTYEGSLLATGDGGRTWRRLRPH
jgi:photosystem II stability/assembly factor-like uncharacterized protein